MLKGIKLPNLVIANNTAISSVLAETLLQWGLSLYIGAPATLTGTVVVQVQTKGSSTWRTLREGALDVTISAGRAYRVDFPAGLSGIRLNSSTNEGAERTFEVSLVESN